MLGKKNIVKGYVVCEKLEAERRKASEGLLDLLIGLKGIESIDRPSCGFDDNYRAGL